MHKFRHISIPVRLPISRQGLAPFRLSSLSLFHFPSPDLFLKHLSSTECIYLFPKPSLNYFGALWCFSFFFLKGEYSFILPWHGQLYTAIAFEMRFICFWLCVCVCLSICVSLCFAVRPSGPGDKSRMSDWEGQRARTITFQWNCRRKRLSLQCRVSVNHWIFYSC